MTTEGIHYLNGAFVPEGESRVSPLDRAFLMADAVYEVVRIHRGRPFLAEAHFARMERGLAELRIKPPFRSAAFGRLTLDLAARNGVESGIVYLQVSRGAAPRSHLLPQGIEPTVFGYAKSLDLPSWKSQPAGVAAITTRDLRWGRCDLKTTMLLPNSLAKQEAHDAGAFEAILVGDGDIVREGASANLFIVRDGILATHPLTERILPGVTRGAVLGIAAEEGIGARETGFTTRVLKAADEAMLTGTGIDLCPVVQIDGVAVGDGKIGPVARRLMKCLERTLDRETAG